VQIADGYRVCASDDAVENLDMPVILASADPIAKDWPESRSAALWIGRIWSYGYPFGGEDHGAPQTIEERLLKRK